MGEIFKKKTPTCGWSHIPSCPTIYLVTIALLNFPFSSWVFEKAINVWPAKMQSRSDLIKESAHYPSICSVLKSEISGLFQVAIHLANKRKVYE